VHINRAIDRGNGVLNIELPRLKVGFCSPGPLRPMNLKTPYTTMRRTGNRHTILTDFTPKIQTRPIADQLSNLPPVSIKLISGSEQEPIWDQLVRTHHYLVSIHDKNILKLIKKAHFMVDKSLQG